MILRFGSLVLLFSLFVFPTNPILAESDKTPSRADSGGVITGKIFIKGGVPLAGGMVFFYDTFTGPALFKNHISTPPALTTGIDTNGAFRAELPPGKYYVKALKKLSAENIRSMQEGDYIYFSVDEKGDAKEYRVTAGAILDIGVISDVVPYKNTDDAVKTAIEGVITDMEGKPVEGVSIFAFLDSAITKRPLYFSRKTGSDGKYLLRIPAGTYYLRVRNKLKGGPPEPGEIIGFFGQQEAAPVTVREGEIKKGIDIKVRTFPGRGGSAAPPAAPSSGQAQQ